MSYRPRSRFLPSLGCAAVSLWLAAGAAAQKPAPGGFSLNAPATPAPAPGASTTPEDKRFQLPKVLKRSPIAYPILANLNRIEGTVGIRFSIDEAGKVTNATVYKSSRSLILDSVVKTRGILEWTFEPATLDGKPVPSTLNQDIQFRLDPAEQRQLALKRLAAPIGLPDPPYPTEALAANPRPRGDCTVGVFWTDRGLVDIINLLKSSGSATLDHAALQFVYENWHTDPAQIKDAKQQFTKVLTFTPPADAAGTPPPLAAATPTPSPAKASPTPAKRAH